MNDTEKKLETAAEETKEVSEAVQEGVEAAGTVAEETAEAAQADGKPEEIAVDQASEPEKGGKKKGKKEKRKKSLGMEILSWVWTLLCAVVIALVIRAVIFEPVRVDGHSMDDTLADGEIMFVSKFDYSTNWFSFPWQSDEAKENALRLVLGGNPARNDVVVCRYPNRGDTNFVKRVVGMPGDTISLQGGWLYVNGEKQEESFLTAEYRTGSLNEMDEYTVPKKGDTFTLQVEGGYVKFFLNGKEWELRSSRMYCKDPDGQTMILYGLNRQLVVNYKGKQYTGSEITDELIQTLTSTEFTIDKDYFFVMGDHRNNSNDSRNVGAIDRSMIVGHVRQIVFPFGKWRGVQ